MRESAPVANRDWARAIAHRYTHEFPDSKSDIESEAYLGMVLAARHESCPADDGEEFRAFAFSFVRGTITDFTRKLRRQRRRVAEMTQPNLVIDPRETPAPGEWEEFRESIAGRLPGPQKRVFLAVYGPEYCESLPRVATQFGLSLDQVKRQHVAVMETLRDLSSLYQVA